MPLSDPWLPAGAPLGHDAAPIAVYRYTPPAGYVLLDNLRCLAIEHHEGPDPGRARFRYVFSETATDPQAPQSVEQALSTTSTLAKAVQPGDRLVVQATRPDGGTEFLFDGFALGFGMHLDARSEIVEIEALGVAYRCRDTPIPGALYRNGNGVGTAKNDVATDLVARFNPRGQPNCTGDSNRSGTAPQDFPVFLDPNIVRSPDVRLPWTLPRAARYLIYLNNTAQTYVQNPAGSTLDSTLVARSVVPGQTYDPNVTSTYTTADIAAPDLPITGQDWPSALRELIGPRGFAMAWVLGADGSNNPRTTLSVFHPQTGPIQDVWLQPRGSALDLTLTNLGAASLERDLSDVANVWTVQGELKQYEASFILAPGFPSQAGDASATTLKTFDASDPNYPSTNHDAYRLYVFDETGEGHYAPASTTKLTTVPSLDALLGAPVSGTAQYVVRRRPPIGRLFSVDADEKPLPYRLSYSTTYAGTAPGLWDGTATDWQPIEGGHQLLDDRIGIRITASNPNQWHIGNDRTHKNPIVLKGVEAIAAANAQNPKFTLRLTCVIEGDQAIDGGSTTNTASPLPYPITRIVDARDRYDLETIAAHSEFNSGTTAFANRDDTGNARAEATARRDATASGVLEGQVTIPRLTTMYPIGTRLRSIQGRGLGLRTDGDGTGSDNVPVYPVVVGYRYELDGGQRTVLMVSDAAVPRGMKRKLSL